MGVTVDGALQEEVIINGTGQGYKDSQVIFAEELARGIAPMERRYTLRKQQLLKDAELKMELSKGIPARFGPLEDLLHEIPKCEAKLS